MGKKAVYEPGELDNVKKRLGPIDEKEAKRMQRLLGGEIGEEKRTGVNPESSGRLSYSGGKKNAGPGIQFKSTATKPKRLVELAPAEDNGKSSGPALPKFQTPPAPSYSERVKMDICAGNSEFGIKTMGQVLISRLSFFNAPHDKVSQWFVKFALNKYYEQMERLVTSTRLIFPRSNAELGRKLQKASGTAFAILNTIRQWKIDIVANEIARFQSHPRNVFVSDFETFLREIYKPIYIMEKLDSEKDIRSAFWILYEIIFPENPGKEAEKLNVRIEEAVKSWGFVCQKLRYLLYPLLMKIISSYYQRYESFFDENSESYSRFLRLGESDKIPPNSVKNDNAEASGDGGTPDGTPYGGEDEYDAAGSDAAETGLYDAVDDTGQSKQDRPRELDAAEAKAFDRGIQILETLFPQAPWNKLDEFPDFYPYFADVFEIKKNGELIAPQDPAHLALILSQILEELLYGFRYIKFVGTLNANSLNEIVDDWHSAISESFEKKYLPLINEYAHYFEHSSQKRNSTYAMNIASDIHWIRRYYFLPNYGYIPPTPPSFLKKDVISLYATARRLRKDLAECAIAIEDANKRGGASANVMVTGIENPWKMYNFQIENPLSKRLNILLGKNQRHNASLIFFTLAIVTVLDSYLSNKNSIASRADTEILFRNSETDKFKPVFWVEKQKDTFQLFKKSIEGLKKQ
ncbi:MAG: hypothetical protein LBF83_04185 [Spirochaetaceae bacterium]|jgi:hypothetical protein|nr:hypothetical protein [Spirochaetaceae bacterium]